MASNKTIIKSASVVAAFTMASRILGLIRDMILARIFGTTIAMEAFVVAFRIPNLLRDLVGEGATNSAVVPVLSEYLVKQKKEQFWHLVGVLLNIFVVVFMAIVLIGMVFTPLIVKLIAPGFGDNQEKLILTIKLTRMMFPFIFFVGMAAYIMGVLNTLKHFTLPALGPCVLNACMIIFALYITPRTQPAIFAMAFAVLIGGALHLVIQVPMLYKNGFRLGSAFKLYHPAAKRIGALLMPRIAGSSIYQMNVLVNTMFASLSNIVGSGAVAALYYANRMVQLPFGIFGIAMSTVCLPTMSHQAAAEETRHLKETTTFALKVVFATVVSSSIGLMVLAQPIIKTIFERGQFSPYATIVTSKAMFFYSFGLFSYGAVSVLSSCFYALQDTKTPVKFSAIALGVNILLGATLMFPMQISGLALATSVSATVNFVLLYTTLDKRLGGLFDRDSLNFALKILLACLVMAIGARISYYQVFTGFGTILRLALTIVSSAAIYFLACYMLGIKEVAGGIKWILRKG